MNQEQSYKSIIAACRSQGFRITRGLKAIVRIIDNASAPLSLQDLEQHPDLLGICDRTTIFRILQRLESAGLLLSLRFSGRAAKYTFHLGSDHKEYLICVECGEVLTLDLDCPVGEMERKISRETGFQDIYHTLTFYGICSHCATSAPGFD